MIFFFFTFLYGKSVKYFACFPFRILFAGVILLRVKMEDRAGSRDHRTLASARRGGRVCTVTSLACRVKWQPNSKVNLITQSLFSNIAISFYIKHKSVILVFNSVFPTCMMLGVEVAHLCRNSGQCLDAGNTHYCRCQAGYTGSYCQEQVDECSPNPCQNGAICTDYLGGYSCEVS